MQSSTLNEMPARIVCLGDVDHGKSTLLARLASFAGTGPGFWRDLASRASGAQLAHVTDQLPEERDDQMTLDASEVRLSFLDRAFTLIDAPGHLELLRNMATAAGRAHAAILVVDAVQGVTSQTRRHLETSVLFGIAPLIVVINKMDSVNYSQIHFRKLATEIQKLGASEGAELAAILPASAHDNAGIAPACTAIPWHQGPSLIEALLAFCATDVRPKTSTDLTRDDAPPLRASLQMHFTSRQRGQVLMARLLSGTLRRGDMLQTASTGECFEATWDGDSALIGTGHSLCLKVTADSSVPARGEIFVKANQPIAMRRFVTGRFIWLSPTPAQAGLSLRVHCGGQIVEGTIESFASSQSQLELGDIATVSLVTKGLLGADSRQEYPTGLWRLVLEHKGELIAAGACL